MLPSFGCLVPLDIFISALPGHGMAHCSTPLQHTCHSGSASFGGDSQNKYAESDFLRNDRHDTQGAHTPVSKHHWLFLQNNLCTVISCKFAHNKLSNFKRVKKSCASLQDMQCCSQACQQCKTDIKQCCSVPVINASCERICKAMQCCTHSSF